MDDKQRLLATPCPACGAWGVLCFPKGVHSIRAERAIAEAKSVRAQREQVEERMRISDLNANRREALANSTPMDMLQAAQGHVRNTWTKRQADRYVKLTTGE